MKAITMKKQYIIIGLLAITTLLWLFSLPLTFLNQLSGFFPIRRELILYSGVLAYIMMAACMVLSLRNGWLEQRLGGLDRMYQIHKWTGIASGILLFIHWMLEIIPKSMVKAGWIAAPARRGMRNAAAGFDLKHLAIDLGEWVAYFSLIMIAIALIRRFPYHWFRKLHKVFPVAFILVTIHSVILMPADRWLSTGGLLIALAAVTGCAAAFLSLFGKIGSQRRFVGQVEWIDRLPNGLMLVDCRLNGHGMKHQAGQFAFIRFSGAKDPHPFSIASSGNDPQRIRFCIKPLGDDTNHLYQSLQTGTRVDIEGPYGCFDFKDSANEQVWVAGGVGIAPFLGRLEHLANQQLPPQHIHLFYCTRSHDPSLPRLAELCQRAGVELHIIDRRQGHSLQLSSLELRPQNAALWFCGPQALGDQLEKMWNKLGMSDRQFYREHFSMR